MAKVYCMQVEILLTASDITYQAVKQRFDVWRLRHKEKILSLCLSKNKIKGYQQTLAAGWSLWISCCLWNRW